LTTYRKSASFPQVVLNREQRTAKGRRIGREALSLPVITKSFVCIRKLPSIANSEGQPDADLMAWHLLIETDADIQVVHKNKLKSVQATGCTSCLIKPASARRLNVNSAISTIEPWDKRESIAIQKQTEIRSPNAS
jgi:hypothetical protein